MDIDKKDFFREFSLRICSSLEIEKALLSAFQYVSSIMPVDELMVGHTNLDTGIMEVVANADHKGCLKKSTKIVLSESVKKNL